MKRYKVLACLILILAISFSMTSAVTAVKSANQSAADLPEGADYKADELIVTFTRNASPSVRTSIRAQQALDKVKDLPLDNSELVRIKDGRSVIETMGRLKTDARVAAVQPNFIYYPDVSPSDDDYYGELWGLSNTGQSVGGYDGVNDCDIDAPEAWPISGGSSAIIVAVIDTGINIDHPDLRANIWVNQAELNGKAGIDDDGNGKIDDIHGWNFYGDNADVFSEADGDEHGTHVAGTIAGVDNDIGVIGVAPNVRIMPLKFLGPNGGFTTDAIEAIEYAMDNGAALANNSWGGGSYDQALYDKISSFGKPFIAAAGNSRTNTDRKAHYPSSYNLPNIVSVASVNNRALLSSFSNYGALSVDVGAPGEYILSSIPSNTYAYYSGTSMATPHVTGIAALMLSVKPGLTGSDVRQILIDTAVDLVSLAGKTVSGGMANACAAVLAASGTTPPPPPSEDTNPPTLTSVDPKAGSKAVPLDTTVTFTFSEDIQIAHSNLVTVKEGKTVVSSDFTLGLNNAILTIVPKSGSLKPGITYTFTVGAGAIADLADNETLNSYSTKFTTAR